jgi:hypothetical protein
LHVTKAVHLHQQYEAFGHECQALSAMSCAWLREVNLQLQRRSDGLLTGSTADCGDLVI